MLRREHELAMVQRRLQKVADVVAGDQSVGKTPCPEVAVQASAKTLRNSVDDASTLKPSCRRGSRVCKTPSQNRAIFWTLAAWKLWFCEIPCCASALGWGQGDRSMSAPFEGFRLVLSSEESPRAWLLAKQHAWGHGKVLQTETTLVRDDFRKQKV